MAVARIIPVLAWFKEPSGEAREERFWSQGRRLPVPRIVGTGRARAVASGYGRFKVGVARADRGAPHRMGLHNDRDPGESDHPA
jgi:hypothetical protein